MASIMVSDSEESSFDEPRISPRSWRELREAQDLELAESLRIDRAADAERKTSKERDDETLRVAGEKRSMAIEDRHSKKLRLGEESPMADFALALRLPSGRRITRNFSGEEPTAHVYDFVEISEELAQPLSFFRGDRVRVLESRGTPLCKSGVSPKTALFVQSSS